MKYINSVFFLLVCSFCFSQESWRQIKAFGSKGNDQSWAICSDSSNNKYITGFFTDSISFGTTQLISKGKRDIFIVKFDPNGNVLWAQSIGGSNDDGGYGVKVDHLGNCYVTAQYQDTIRIGTYSFTSRGAEDILLIKFAPSGNMLWAKSGGGIGSDQAISLDIDSKDCIYVSSIFSDTATFDTHYLISKGGYDIALLKYDSYGNIIWASRSGGAGLDVAQGIEVSTDGTFCITGSFENTANFDTINVVAAGGSWTFFVAKYDDTGKIKWLKQAGCSGQSQGFAVHTDSGKKIYVDGSFEPGNFNFGSTVLQSYGGFDIFVAKYDSLGNFVWAKQAGGTSNDAAYGMSTDKMGNNYITGSYASNAQFDSLTIAGSNNLFIAKYDETGKVQWVKTAQGTGNHIGTAVCLFNSDIWITGIFTRTITCDSVSLNSIGGQDVFLGEVIQQLNNGITEFLYPQNDILVYPNPGSGIFILRSPCKMQKIEIFNLLGEKIQYALNESFNQIDISDRNPGIYFIRITTASGITDRKVVLLK